MTRRLLLAILLTVVALPGPDALADDPELVVVVRTGAGVALDSATVTVDGATVDPAPDGRLAVTSPGRVSVTAPAYLPVTFRWDGRPGRLTVTLVPRPVFAIHVTGEAAGSEEAWQALLGFAERTAINALVIDLKDESGRVFAATPSGVAAVVGTEEALFDLEARTTEAHERGLYVIVRVVTFLDPIAGPARPEWAAWDGARSRPFAKGWQVFLDPWDDQARSYALDLAVDACELGVDEVQFDYVRFPDGFGARVEFDGPADSTGRATAITSFLREARAALSGGGCATAADIFGFITSTPGEGGIGQQLEQLAGVVDVLSPMLYPSHYSTGWYGFRDPNAHPYEVVAGALLDGERRLGGSAVVVRPWIQSFYYSGSQIMSESRAADDHGVGWMLWNSASNYAESSIIDAGSLTVAGHSSNALFRLFPLSGFTRVPRRVPLGPIRAWME